MRRSFHVHLDIRSAVENWAKRDWRNAAKSARMPNGSRPTPEALRSSFIDMLTEGKLALPIGEACSAWDWKTGCTVHDEAPASAEGGRRG